MQIEELRLTLVDKIMNLNNIPLLEKLAALLNLKSPKESLTVEQLSMLQMAQEDIDKGRFLEDDTLTAEL